MKPQFLWAFATLVYLVFFAWYTNLSGPLSEAEIEKYQQVLQAGSLTSERAALIETFMRTDSGDDFIMVNLLDLNASPPELPATGPDAQAEALLDHYMEHMYPALLARASHPVFFGVAVSDALDLAGIEGAEHWERGALFRYRSRRDFMDIVLNPQFNERHEYKMQALTKTIAYPVEPLLHPGDFRLLVALLLFSVTAVTHLLAGRKAPG